MRENVPLFILVSLPDDTLEQRQAILQKYKSDGICIQYDDIKNMTIADMKAYFAWKPVTYIFHNQIDLSSNGLPAQNQFNTMQMYNTAPMNNQNSPQINNQLNSLFN